MSILNQLIQTQNRNLIEEGKARDAELARLNNETQAKETSGERAFDEWVARQNQQEGQPQPVEIVPGQEPIPALIDPDAGPLPVLQTEPIPVEIDDGGASQRTEVAAQRLEDVAQTEEATADINADTAAQDAETTATETTNAETDVASTETFAEAVGDFGEDVADLSGLADRPDETEEERRRREDEDAPPAALGASVGRAGWALVGEKGPELVQLPAGANVYPNNQTNAILKPLGMTLVQAFASGGKMLTPEDFLRKLEGANSPILNPALANTYTAFGGGGVGGFDVNGVSVGPNGVTISARALAHARSFYKRGKDKEPERPSGGGGGGTSERPDIVRGGDEARRLPSGIDFGVINAPGNFINAMTSVANLVNAFNDPDPIRGYTFEQFDAILESAGDLVAWVRAMNAMGPMQYRANMRAYAGGGLIDKPTLLSDLLTGRPFGVMAERAPEYIVPQSAAQAAGRDPFAELRKSNAQLPTGPTSITIPIQIGPDKIETYLVDLETRRYQKVF
jgi:hypothetical protein